MDFKVSNDYTYEEYRQFNRVISIRVLHQPLLIGIISLLVFGQAAYILITKGTAVFLRILPLEIIYIVMIAFIIIKAMVNVKKTWESKQIAKDAVVTFHFTPEKLEISGMDSEGTYEYEKIKRRVETDTHVYLMMQSNLGYIIRKSGLTPEQLEFIREKCPKHRKRSKDTKDVAANDSPQAGISKEGAVEDTAEEEQPLFCADTVYGLKTYLKYSHVMYMRVSRLFLVPVIMVILVTLYFYFEFGSYGVGYFFKEGFWRILIILFIIDVIRPVMILIGWKRNPSMRNRKQEYRFYTDRFRVQGSAGKSYIPYNKLHRIIETRSDFYLMISRNQGFVVGKKDCPEGLESFLSQKSKDIKALRAYRM
ncbi:MAG: YcxB family protein [Lachnospiraceae bacterium]|nr:YcxB family protein [Lachnospiraceae bacterium]